MAAIYSQFSGWLTPMVRIGPERLAEIIQLEMHRYVISKTDKCGLVYDKDGVLDFHETNAAFHILFMSGHLTERIVIKAFAPLKQEIRRVLEAEGGGAARKNTAGFSLSEFYNLVFLSKLFDSVTKRNLFQEFGYDSKKLVKQSLCLFRKPDMLFAETGGTGESSLFSTSQAVWILKASGIELADFDPKLESAVKTAVLALRRKSGGYSDNRKEKIGTIAGTFAGCYLTRLLAAKDSALKETSAFISASNQFLARLRCASGGYRADGLTPTPTLITTLMAVLAFGMLNDYKYRSLPKKDIIAYLNLLERRDGGAAADEWKSGSDVESTLLGLVLRVLLGDKFVLQYK